MSFSGDARGATKEAGLRRTSRSVLAFATAVVSILFLCAASSALAAEVHVRSSSFGAGELELREHSGLAVNQTTHDIYVADTGHGRIAEFEADGAFVRGFGSFVNPDFVAVDNSPTGGGDVYVVDSATNTVSKFEADGTPITVWGTSGTLGGFSEIKGITVDESGDLFVLENTLASWFNQDGTSHSAPFTPPRESSSIGLAVDSEGNLYKAAASPEIVKFSISGTPLAEPDPRADALALTIDRSDDDLYVLQGGGGQPFVDRFAVNCGEHCEPLEEFGSGELVEPQGVAVDGSDHTAYITDLATSEVSLFEIENVEPPTATIAAPSAVEYSTAHLSGEVDPEGHQATCRFQYVTEAQFIAEGFTGAQSSPCTAGPGSGTAAAPVEADLTGLSPHTTYHVRLAATNPAGTFFTAEPNQTIETKAVVAPTVSIEPNPAHTATTAHLVGHINPNAPGSGPGQDPAFDVTWHFECTPACPGEGGLSGNLEANDSNHEVFSDVAELTPGTAYQITLVAENAGGAATKASAGLVSFSTPAAAPTVDVTSVSTVGATEATLHATINPGGGTTTYHFEYMGKELFESIGFSEPFSTAETAFGFADNKAHEASAAITGLAPETAYVFRAVATNSAAPAGIAGSVKTFATRSATPSSSGCPNEAQRLGPSAALPDCRAFEAVSPVATEGSEQSFVPGAGSIYFSSIGQHGIYSQRPFEVASDGHAVIYAGDTPIGEGTGNGRAGSGNAYRSQANPTGGWGQINIQPPAFGPSYVAFSADLSSGIIGADTSLAPTGLQGYEVLYAHGAAAATGPYDPLFTQISLNRSANSFNSALLYAGANSGTSSAAEGEYLLLEANDLLIPGIGPLEKELQTEVQTNIAEGEEGTLKRILYDSVGGIPHVVNVLPDGTAHADASFGAFPESTSGEGAPALEHAISANGTKIFWTDGVTHSLYVRENATRPQSPLDSQGQCAVPTDGCTIELDASQVPSGAGGGGRFLTASNDGSRVFFVDLGSAELTEDTEPGSGQNLYEYNFNAPPGQRLTDLTPTVGPGFLGFVGASEDGSYFYFVAEGILATGVVDNGGGPEEAEVGRPNLYLFHNGVTTFLAGLSAADNEEVVPFDGTGERFESGDWKSAVGFRTAEVTPDGHSLIFLSARSLTGYDNGQTAFRVGVGPTTTSLDEIFLYEVEPDKISCVSCDPSGTPPVPTEFDNYRPTSGTPIGGYFPITKRKEFRTQPRVISNDGARVFFDSGEPLVPQDTDGWMDAYEWEHNGVGSCHRPSGCVFLLSNGTGHESSYLLGAGTSGPEAGDDAFIITREQLIAADRNENFDVYDARVDGASPAAEVEPCAGEACRAPGVAPPGAPSLSGSSSFFGPADPSPPKACRKSQIRRHGKCVKQMAKKHKQKHHKKKGHGQHKKASAKHGGHK